MCVCVGFAEVPAAGWRRVHGRVWIVKKGIVFLVCLLAVMCLLTAGMAAAQGLPWTGPTPVPGSYSGLSGVAGFFGSDFRIVPSLLVAYKRLGLNFNLDVPAKDLLAPFISFDQLFPYYGSLLDTNPLDFKLRGANLLIGAFRLDAQLTRNVGVYGSVSANVPRRIGVEAGVGPGFGSLIPQSYAWTGSRLQWSQFEIGASYKLNRGIALIAGIKWERTTVRFSDPEPVPSTNNFGFDINPVLPFVHPFVAGVPFDGYGGDLRALFSTPFVGVSFRSRYTRCSFKIGSAASSLRLPLNLSHAGPYRAFSITVSGIPLPPPVSNPIFSVGRSDISEQAVYTFKNAGLFLEGKVESDIPMNDSLNLTFWAEGSWLRIRGNGSVALAGESSTFLTIIGIPFFRSPVGYSSTENGNSTLTQYSLSLGMSSSLTF